MKRIGILGSTGSIGTQTLELVNNDSNFKVCYLSAFSNADLLIKQAKHFLPDAVLHTSHKIQIGGKGVRFPNMSLFVRGCLFRSDR